ncbi:MAG TPA: C-GCAxxG-C-C family protein [Dongiaceae bacterium]|nr:C-GCAxxG-C-C family protein [Dongiaceae bacterium]
MSDDTFRIAELEMRGYGCSQILALMALEAQGRENPELVRAMSGLLLGMGCGKVCGALTGGCCVLGIYAGKGSEDSNADPRLPLMLGRFVEWFETEFKGRFGSIDCCGIVQDDARQRMARCPLIVTETLGKIREILAENDFHFDEPPASA